jgi:hypothetical protein
MCREGVKRCVERVYRDVEKGCIEMCREGV